MISKNEIVWSTLQINGKSKYCITSTALRDVYYLYEIIDDKFKKTKYKAKNPLDLEKYIKK